MNQLNVSLQHSITTLAAHGWSHRRIARELAIHRETVGRHLRLVGSKPANVLSGSAGDPAAKPAIPLAGSESLLASKPAIPLPGSLAAGRPNLCGPLREVIVPAVQAGLSAQRIYQDLIGTHAFTGSYHSVQRFVRQLVQRQPVPFVRMEVAAGAGFQPAGTAGQFFEPRPAVGTFRQVRGQFRLGGGGLLPPQGGGQLLGGWAGARH
ncbi:MAG: hypothetical protein KJ070_27105 [Verrucomicrobia bacterium]|nr:hypothetical protein [Verrucomicrobiota bacterium]